MITNEIYNPRLRNYIIQKLGLPKYGNGFDQVVEEIFLRENLVLNLSPEELLEDIKNFSKSVSGIEWANDIENNFMGAYYAKEKKIKLNYKYFQELLKNMSPEEAYTSMLETITHECLHGMQMNVYGRNRAEGYNSKLKNRSHALYEIATQAAAARMTRNRTMYEYRDVLTGDGYADEIFAMPLIAATFGVKEHDVIKYSMREREKLIDLLNTNIGDKLLTSDLLDRIEEQLEYMHSANYPDPSQTKFINLSDKAKSKVTKAAINNLVNICQEAMADRIKNIPFEYDKNIVDNLLYDYQKINMTLQFQSRKFGYLFDKENSQEFFESKLDDGPYSEYIKNSLKILSGISGKKKRNLLPFATDIIRAMKIENYGYIKKLGLNFEEFEFASYSSRISEEHMHDDYNDFRFWNNSDVFQALQTGKFQLYHVFKKEPISVDAWKEIDTEEGLEKLAALKYAFLANKKKYAINTKQGLLDILDQRSTYFGNSSFYEKFTRNSMDLAPSLIPVKLSPRETMRKYFNKKDDQVFIAALIADRFIKKAFDEKGNPKHLDNEAEARIQAQLYPTFLKCTSEMNFFVEDGLNQLKLALKNILINDEYQGVLCEKNQDKLSLYGKSMIFDIVSQPLVDELLNERRISPEKKEAFKYIAQKTNQEFPNQGPARLVMLLQKYKNGESKYIIANYVSHDASMAFDYYFQDQRDYEDLLGVICNEYSKQNYKNEYSEDSKENLDIQTVLNELGPDEFREAIIDAYFKNDYSRIPNLKSRELVSRDIEHFIIRMADTYVRNIEEVSRVSQIFKSDIPQHAVPKVSLIDISKIVDQEVNQDGIYGKVQTMLGVFENLKNKVKGKHGKSADDGRI